MKPPRCLTYRWRQKTSRLVSHDVYNSRTHFSFLFFWKWDRLKNQCKQCQKETSNPLFCSTICSGLFNNSPKTHYCKCGNIKGIGSKQSKKKYCEECATNPKINKIYADWNSVTISELRAKSKNINQFHSRIRSLARSSKKLTSCIKCGYSKHVEVCHIISVKDFDQNKTIAQLNNESNLICLCPNCHWEFDHPECQIKPERKIPLGNNNFSQPYPDRRKVIRPSLSELLDMVSKSNYEAVGRQYGVTGKSIKKWIFQYQKHQVEQ